MLTIKNTEVIEDVLTAIKDVKKRVKVAQQEMRGGDVYNLMGDLYALQAVLAYEMEIVVDKNKAA